MSNSKRDLYFEHLKGQGQFAYFQLGVAASAIAFAVHETDGRSLYDTPWLIGAGVSFWGLSFALGCFGLQARQTAIRTNLQYLEATDGVPHGMREVDPELKAAMAQAKQITADDAERPGRRFKWQQWTLFLGAIAYVSGHVLQMADTPRRAPQKANAAASVARAH